LKRTVIKQIFIVLLITGCFNQCYSKDAEKLISGLAGFGFENVRAVFDKDTCIITIENHVYRWDVRAVVTALDLIASNLEKPVPVNLILLEKGIPKIVLKVESSVWIQFKNKEITSTEFKNQLYISEETTPAWEKIKDEKAFNRPNGKIDLVIYPQFAFENTLLSGIYEYQFNIAPAVQLSLWKGMDFTAQVIFPIYNELGYEGGFIRPGQVIISQEVRSGRFSGRLSVGNFSSNRYGADVLLRYLLPNENWNLKMNAGYTGSSHFFDNQWKHTPVNTFTGSVSATWFVPRFNLQFEGGIRQYIYGDAGIFGTCTRWFKETAIGFYAQAGTEDVNGGFFCTIPFPFGKRNRKHNVRVVPPEYLDFSYNAGTEYYYGQTYQVNPANNRVNQFYNADYLKNKIVNWKDSSTENRVNKNK
jgi:hypothetical protein